MERGEKAKIFLKNLGGACLEGERVIHLHRLNNDKGPVVQLVRIRACHARGRGFESRPDRKNKEPCKSMICEAFSFPANTTTYRFTTRFTTVRCPSFISKKYNPPGNADRLISTKKLPLIDIRLSIPFRLVRESLDLIYKPPSMDVKLSKPLNRQYSPLLKEFR